MLIDWFTIVAQAVNFLVLLWLMKRFLYKPVLRAIAAREKLIAEKIADADTQKSEAQTEREDFQLKNQTLDQQRETLLREANEEAQTERQRLLDEARNDDAELRSKRKEAMRTEERALHQAISRRAQEEVFAIARKALTDLGGVSLEDRLSKVFMRRLQELSRDEKATLAEALEMATDPARVRSAFDLPEEQRAAIQNALNETFSAEISVRFETTPDLIGGIELTTNGQKVAWSIEDYLASLEQGVAELLKEKEGSDPEPDARSKPEAKPAETGAGTNSR